MFFKLVISLILIITVFGSAILYVSRPYGGPKKVINFLRSIYLHICGNARNLFSVMKLIKRRGIKSVRQRYPKTTDFIISSFLSIIVIVTITIIALLADL
jgi:nitrate reductase gamma subunit